MLLSLGKQQQQQQKYLNSFNYLSAYTDGEKMPAHYAAGCCGWLSPVSGGGRAGVCGLEGCQHCGGKG